MKHSLKHYAFEVLFFYMDLKKTMLSSLHILRHVPYGPIFLITAEFSHYWTQQAPWTVGILCNGNGSGSFWDHMSFWDLMSAFLSLSPSSFIKLICQPIMMNVLYLNSLNTLKKRGNTGMFWFNKLLRWNYLLLSLVRTEYSILVAFFCFNTLNPSLRRNQFLMNWIKCVGTHIQSI